MLSGMYILYIGLRTMLNPSLGPVIAEEDRVSWLEKLILLRDMIMPVLLIVIVLGIIFSGAATPVEAAGIGSFGAMIVAALHNRLTLENIRAAAITTMRMSAMVLWIIFGGNDFLLVSLFSNKGNKSLLL